METLLPAPIETRANNLSTSQGKLWNDFLYQVDQFIPIVANHIRKAGAQAGVWGAPPQFSEVLARGKIKGKVGKNENI